MSVFEGVLVFFHDVGVYTVVLPFLLVFTIVFALLEKTRVLGVDRINDAEVPKKNINAMVAFVIGFLVVASTQLVAAINQIASHVVLLLLLITFFMLLVGTMEHDRKDGFALTGWPKTAFMYIMFAGVILIFLNAFGWLQAIWNYVFLYWDTQFVGMIILLVVIVALMWFITSGSGSEAKSEE